jgi:hypothetical protein
MDSYLPLSGLILLIGGALVVSSVYVFFRQRSQLRRSIMTTGTVIELLRHHDPGDYLLVKSADGRKLKRKYDYRPVIRFETETGRSVKFAARVASRPIPYQVGDQVSVIYDPNKPQKAQINRALYLWFHVIMLLFFGVFALAMGLLGIIMAEP